MFLENKRVIEDGDLVVLLQPERNGPPLMFCERLRPSSIHRNAYGSYKIGEAIGKEYGIRVPATRTKGFLYILHMTPELWTLVLRHRTQILYYPDISLITMFLDLKPGSVVIESGTGSGSFSHSLARTIAPTGHLYTFEFHEERAKTARQEFIDHGLQDIITVTHADVVQSGFGASVKGIADAVFLDLPAPWDAIAAAKRTLKRSKLARICTFSPCIEQVQRTVDTLREQGFFEIRMYEYLVRDYEVRRILPTSSLDVPKDLGSALIPKFANDKANSSSFESDPSTDGSNKRPRSENDVDVSTSAASSPSSSTVANSASTTTKPDHAAEKIVAKPAPIMRGHTSYLTFALLQPIPREIKKPEDSTAANNEVKKEPIVTKEPVSSADNDHTGNRNDSDIKMEQD